MTNKKSPITEMVKNWRILMKRLEPLSKMSLEDKIKKLRGLKKNKENIESKLKYINITITHLEYMPDVARYHASRNEFAMNLLAYLKDNNGISYAKLRSSLSENPQDGMILNFGLDLLARVELIEKHPNSSNALDYNIELTKSFEKLSKQKSK